MKLLIDGDPLPLAVCRQIWEAPINIRFGDAARRAVSESRKSVDRLLNSNQTAYGINTGFGKLATSDIGIDNLERLQKNLVRSHATGVGDPLSDSVVRLAIVLKVVALARGCSGVRTELVDVLCELVNHGIYPVVPSKGSVGASGDLAPLAHIARAVIGEERVSLDGTTMDASEALRKKRLKPLNLAPKEGLALLNGTQVSTALALAALFRLEHVLSASLIAGAMSTDAVLGSDTPFDDRIHQLRGHAGQIDVGRLLFGLMHDSEIRASHRSCRRVQDPYSIRCQPQVVGACLDSMRHAASVLRIEANAVTDNPIVCDDQVLSGGNFHAEPVALVADQLAVVIAELGSISERRIALLLDSNLSRLPAFLVGEDGLNSGFMSAQVTAAALASENKSLAHPASVDTIPTSANQEDHVSMATFAARRLHDMLDNVEHILAIELLAAAQGVELRRPFKSSVDIETSIETIREISPHYSDDRSLADDIRGVRDMIDHRLLSNVGESVLPSSCL